MVDPDDVDICVTCVAEKPPQLPLREELVSLGVEVIYKASGVGAKAVKHEANEAAKRFREKSKKKKFRLFPRREEEKRQRNERKKRIEKELRSRQKSVSYNSYNRKLKRMDSSDSESMSSWDSLSTNSYGIIEACDQSACGPQAKSKLEALKEEEEVESDEESPNPNDGPNGEQGAQAMADLQQQRLSEAQEEALEEAKRLSLPTSNGTASRGNKSRLPKSPLSPTKMSLISAATSPTKSTSSFDLSVEESDREAASVKSASDSSNDNDVDGERSERSDSSLIGESISAESPPTEWRSQTDGNDKKEDSGRWWYQSHDKNPSSNVPDGVVTIPSGGDDDDIRKAVQDGLNDDETEEWESWYGLTDTMCVNDSTRFGSEEDEASLNCADEESVGSSQTNLAGLPSNPKEFFMFISQRQVDQHDVSTALRCYPELAFSRTKFKKRLPLHVACNRRVPKMQQNGDFDAEQDIHSLLTKSCHDLAQYKAVVQQVAGTCLGACAIVDQDGDLPVHLAARRLLQWEYGWKTILNPDAISKDDRLLSCVVQIQKLMAKVIEIVLEPVCSDKSICQSRTGSIGRLLPLHIASMFSVSYSIFDSLLKSFPESASVPCDLSEIKTHHMHGAVALELLKQNTAEQTAREGTAATENTNAGWSSLIQDSFNTTRKADLLFSFHPNILPYRRDSARLERLESMIRVEAKFAKKVEGKPPLGRAASSFWLWMCLFDGSSGGQQDNYARNVLNIVYSLDPSLVEKLAMIQSTNGPIASAATPPCGIAIQARIEGKPFETALQLIKNCEDKQRIAFDNGSVGSGDSSSMTTAGMEKISDQREGSICPSTSNMGSPFVPSGSLLRRLFNVQETSYPTSFVMLPYKLVVTKDGSLSLETSAESQTALRFAQHLMKMTNPEYLLHLLEKKSMEHVGYTVKGDRTERWSLMEERYRNLQSDMLALFRSAQRSYLYLLDEVTGEPIVQCSNDSVTYPVCVDDSGETMKRVLSLMLMGMAQMRGDQSLCVISQIITSSSEDMPNRWLDTAQDIVAYASRGNLEGLVDEEDRQEYLPKLKRFIRTLEDMPNREERPETDDGSEWFLELTIVKGLLEDSGLLNGFMTLESLGNGRNGIVWTRPTAGIEDRDNTDSVSENCLIDGTTFSEIATNLDTSPSFTTERTGGLKVPHPHSDSSFDEGSVIFAETASTRSWKDPAIEKIIERSDTLTSVVTGESEQRHSAVQVQPQATLDQEEEESEKPIDAPGTSPWVQPDAPGWVPALIDDSKAAIVVQVDQNYMDFGTQDPNGKGSSSLIDGNTTDDSVRWSTDHRSRGQPDTLDVERSKNFDSLPSLQESVSSHESLPDPPRSTTTTLIDESIFPGYAVSKLLELKNELGQSEIRIPSPRTQLVDSAEPTTRLYRSSDADVKNMPSDGAERLDNCFMDETTALSSTLSDKEDRKLSSRAAQSGHKNGLAVIDGAEVQTSILARQEIIVAPPEPPSERQISLSKEVPLALEPTAPPPTLSASNTENVAKSYLGVNARSQLSAGEGNISVTGLHGQVGSMINELPMQFATKSSLQTLSKSDTEDRTEFSAEGEQQAYPVVNANPLKMDTMSDNLVDTQEESTSIASAEAEEAQAAVSDLCTVSETKTAINELSAGGETLLFAGGTEQQEEVLGSSPSPIFRDEAIQSIPSATADKGALRDEENIEGLNVLNDVPSASQHDGTERSDTPSHRIMTSSKEQVALQGVPESRDDFAEVEQRRRLSPTEIPLTGGAGKILDEKSHEVKTSGCLSSKNQSSPSTRSWQTQLDQEEICLQSIHKHLSEETRKNDSGAYPKDLAKETAAEMDDDEMTAELDMVLDMDNAQMLLYRLCNLEERVLTREIELQQIKLDLHSFELETLKTKHTVKRATVSSVLNAE